MDIKRLNILGERYSVHVRRMADDIQGWQCDKKMEIVLAPGQNIDQQRDTLLHEVIHAVDDVHSLKLSERQVRLIATSLRAVFTSNPKFAKFVSE